MRPTLILTAALVAGAFAAACNDVSPTSAEGPDARAEAGPSAAAAARPPILIEPLTARHRFTDEVAAQIRLKPEGRAREVVNIPDASHMAVVRFTVQPGVRFPWHTHPGLVMVAVTQGELVFVYGDDCRERPYRAGAALVDPGFGNIHYAFNRTEGETVIVATFLGVPETGPLTLPVDEATSAALNDRCGAAPAAHTH